MTLIGLRQIIFLALEIPKKAIQLFLESLLEQ